MLGLGLALLACKRDAGSKEAPLAFDPDAKAFVDHTEHRFEIALVEPGAEPRELLRYAGQAPRRTVSMRVTAELWEDEPVADLRVAWWGLPPEGELRRYLYDVVEVTPLMLEHDMDQLELQVIRRITKMLDAVAGQATGSASGLDRVIQTRGELPTQPSPGGVIASVALPLPEQAIGVGAVWTKTAVYEEEVHGFREQPGSGVEGKGPRFEPVVETRVFTNSTRYTLIERSADTLTVVSESSTVADDPERAPSSRSSGRFVISLSDPLPRSGKLEITIRMAGPGFPGGDPGVRTDIELDTLQ